MKQRPTCLYVGVDVDGKVVVPLCNYRRSRRPAGNSRTYQSWLVCNFSATELFAEDDRLANLTCTVVPVCELNLLDPFARRRFCSGSVLQREGSNHSPEVLTTQPRVQVIPETSRPTTKPLPITVIHDGSRPIKRSPKSQILLLTPCRKSSL